MMNRKQLSVNVCRNRLQKAFDTAHNETEKSKAAFYTDTETPHAYSWKWDLNNQTHTWTINRTSGLISKQTRCKV